MPFTTVVSGTTITAAWGNVVRDQVVTPFASASARTSAVTTPVEGMLSFLADVNRFDYYDGAAWIPLPEPVYCNARQTVAQTLSTATWTAITFDVEDADSPVGQHSTASNTDRYTALYTGLYAASGGVSFAGNATERRGARWTLNGTVINGSSSLIYAGGANPIVVPAQGITVALTAADILRLEGYQQSGGNLNTSVTAPDQSAMTVHMICRT